VFLSIFTDELALDITKALPILQSWGLTHVDLRGRVFGRAAENLSPEQLADLKKLLDDHGMTVGCLQSSLAKVHLPDAARCAALLRKHRVPVIVSTVHRLPRRRGDAYDAAYTLPERLRAAGIPFCIASGNTYNARNLPYQAATAAAYGLPRGESLKAITLYPARILGIEDRVGSLEVGKDATLIVTDGDPLETPTHVEAAFIQGRRVDLSDRQKRLWRKYQEKYRRLEAKE
jgi:hypothetical protein